MKKHTFRILVVCLVIILAVVSFYMLYVHVPYYNYHHQLDEIRNEICEQNHYEYMDYFSEYRGKSKYYMLKVKIDGVESYVAYDTKQKLVDTYQEMCIRDSLAIGKRIALFRFRRSRSFLSTIFYIVYGRTNESFIGSFVFEKKFLFVN